MATTVSDQTMDRDGQRARDLVQILLHAIQTGNSSLEECVKTLTSFLDTCSNLDPAFYVYINDIHTRAARLCCVQALLRRRVWDDAQEGRLQNTYRELRQSLLAHALEPKCGSSAIA